MGRATVRAPPQKKKSKGLRQKRVEKKNNSVASIYVQKKKMTLIKAADRDEASCGLQVGRGRRVSPGTSNFNLKVSVNS